MLGKYEDLDSQHEISSIIAEHIEYKSNTLAVPKTNDSFESSILMRNGSDSSFISLTSNESSYVQNSKPYTMQLPKSAKILKPNRVENNQSRPASILKTTFLSEDTSNCNFPKKPPHPKDFKRPLEQNFVKTNEKIVKNEVKFIDENYKDYSYKDNSEKICELENQILKKDALIETLRMRVTKMVQELEETHRKISLVKNNANEDCISKISLLNTRCQEYEKKIYENEAQTKEMSLVITKKDQEINTLDMDFKNKRLELDKQSELIYRIENEYKKLEEKKAYLEKLADSLQLKLDNTSKALEMSNSHKNHLEQEVIRLEIVKRNQENEMKVIIDENSKSLSALSKKLEDSQLESKSFQKLLKDCQSANDVLQKEQTALLLKLTNFEEEISKLDLSKFITKDRHARSTSSKLALDTSKISQEPDSQFNTKNHCESCCNKSRYHKKSHSASSSLKPLLKEIMEMLQINNVFEVVPTLKRSLTSGKEKKLVRKLGSLVKECFAQERSKDVQPAQIWRLVKRVFEDYAILKRENSGSEVQIVRQYLGEGNLLEKVVAISQENKAMAAVLAKVRQKMRLGANCSLNEIENALR